MFKGSKVGITQKGDEGGDMKWIMASHGNMDGFHPAKEGHVSLVRLQGASDR